MLKFALLALLAQDASSSAIDYAYFGVNQSNGAGLLSYTIPAFVPTESDPNTD